MNSLIVVKTFLAFWLLVQAKGQVILKEPVSLLILANETGDFSCRARCEGYRCNSFWIINGTLYRTGVNKPGMRSSLTHSENGNEYTYSLTLIVSASDAMNNTTIQCEFEATGYRTDYNQSAVVNLFVISRAPISPNPLLTKNKTHLILMWSPPFLWPGQRIQHYNIIVTNNTDGGVEHHMLDTSIMNPIIAVPFVINSNSLQFNSQNMLSCRPRKTFSISPVDGSVLEPMQTFNISDWAWTFPSRSEFTLLAINVSVLFRSDGTPALVVVNVQLPRTTCSFSELKYTFIIENKEENLKAEVETFPDIDSGDIEENIGLDLKENQEYSLKLRVKAQSQTATSQKHIFNTQLPNNSSCSACNSSKKTTGKNNLALPYMALTGVFMAFTLVLLVAILVIFVRLCIHHRKQVTEIKLCKSKNRACNVMVHNPIYDGDGPVYESVQNQLDINNETELRDQQYDNLRLSWNNTARYVNPPVHLQYLYSNAASNASDSVNAPINASASVSMPPTTPRVMSLKKNGQERNKLHLTLSLGENDFSDNHTSVVAPNSMPKVCAVAPKDVDEPYTVMSPAGVH